MFWDINLFIFAVWRRQWRTAKNDLALVRPRGRFTAASHLASTLFYWMFVVFFIYHKSTATLQTQGSMDLVISTCSSALNSCCWADHTPQQQLKWVQEWHANNITEWHKILKWQEKKVDNLEGLLLFLKKSKQKSVDFHFIEFAH